MFRNHPAKSCLLLLQPLCCHCVECVIHHEQDVCEEQQYIYIYVVQTSNKSDRGVEALLILTCEQLNVTTSVRRE